MMALLKGNSSSIAGGGLLPGSRKFSFSGNAVDLTDFFLLTGVAGST